MKKQFLFFVFAILVFAGLAGCLGSANNNSTTPLPAAGLLIAQTSPDAPNVDVYANSEMIVTNLAFGNSTTYLSANSATYEIRVTPVASGSNIVDTIVPFAPGIAYSFFIIDSLSKIKAAVTTDNFTVPTSDSARFRFLHFSPNAPAIDLAFAGGSVIYSSRTFNDQNNNPSFANFISIPTGIYNLELRAAGTSTVLLPLPNISFASGKVYTFYAKGFAGGAGVQALSLGTILNN